MADKKNEQARNMGGENPGNQSQQAPGRGGNDFEKNRETGGSQTSNRESGFDREDREREQPGSKQHDEDLDR